MHTYDWRERKTTLTEQKEEGSTEAHPAKFLTNQRTLVLNTLVHL